MVVSVSYTHLDVYKRQVSNHDCTLEVAQPVGEVAETAYLKLVVTPARILFWKTNFPLAILLSVGVPLEASINKPTGYPIKTELKTDSAEFLLICKAFWNKVLIPEALVEVDVETIGPIIVILENTAEVCGVRAEPLASLSDSKALEPETSAIAASLTPVSYTHLDVYKRQIDNIGRCRR